MSLAFKDANGKPYPKWEERRLGEVAQVIGGGTPKTSVSEYWGGDIPWLSIADFNNGNNKVFNTEKTITLKGLENSSAKLLEENDLVISARGTVGALTQLGKPMAFNQSCYGLKAIKNTNSDFLYYILYRELAFLKTRTHGSVFNTITGNVLKNLKLQIPTLPEQRKIADFFSKIDEKIALAKSALETAKALKKASLQRIFSGELAFTDAGKPYPKWEEKRLGEVLKYEQPNKYLVKSTDYSDEFEIPVLTANKAFILGYSNETENVYDKGACIILDDFTLDTKFVNFKFKMKSSAIKILTAKDDNNIKFMFEKLQSLNLKPEIHKRHYISMVQKKKTLIPTLPEQRKIADFFSEVDKKISLKEKKLSTLNSLKKAFLQQIFSP